MLTPALQRTSLLAITALSLAARPAFAATANWTGGGANNNFAQAPNWQSNTAPVAGDILRFGGTTRLNPKNNLGSTVFQSVVFRNNAGAFTINGDPLHLDEGVTNNSSQRQTFASDVHLGPDATIETTDDATTVFAANLYVKNGLTFTGNGLTLTQTNLTDEPTPRRKDDIVINSGTVRSTGSWLTAANVVVRKGALIFRGTSSVSSIGEVTVGQKARDNGYLKITDGAYVASGDSVIGKTNGSTGVVDVTDGGSWQVGTPLTGTTSSLYNLTVGLGGHGTLNITKGGRVNTSALAIGSPLDPDDFESSYGELFVSDKDSLLTSDILFLSSGKITVQNGGRISSAATALSALPLASGTLALNQTLITGKGSRLTTLALAVGAGATLTITDKGQVKAGLASIQGFFADAIVTSLGSGSQFNVTDDLEIDGAVGGRGVLQIFQGGLVHVGSDVLMGTTAPISIPEDENDYAAQAVLYDGATWRIEEDLVVGQAGTGNVSVDHFSHIDAKNMVIGSDDTGAGFVSVRGTGAAIGFDTTDFSVRMQNLTVGRAGLGKLLIEDFGTVVAHNIMVGEERGSVGKVILDGGASGQPILQALDKITIGDKGTAVVVVKNRAQLNVIDTENGDAKGPIKIGKKGVLNIGDGGEMGYVNAKSVSIADGGVLEFNHTTLASSPYFQAFDANLSGAGKLIHSGPGDTVLTGNGRNFSGQTVIKNGRLITTRSTSLGTSDVTLRGGALGVAQGLGINSLSWGKGALEFELGYSFLDVADTVSNLNGKGGTFIFNPDSFFGEGSTYDLITAANGFVGFDISDFTGNEIFGLDPFFSFSSDGLTLSVLFTDNDSGPVIDNGGNGPNSTPTNSDFTVDGSVTTAGGANTVNSLLFTPGSTLTINDLLTVSSGELTVNSGSATISGDTINLPNGLTKLGTGLLNIVNEAIVNGVAEIFEGTLAINGKLVANSVVVDFLAMLKGSGLIVGNLFNDGVVAPGNSPGTLTVNGNFTQSSDGILEIEVASLSNFDRLVVSGQATLAGELNVVSFDGFQFAFGQQFEFLQAGSIVGTFDSITVSNPDVFRGRLLVDGGNASVLIAPASYTLVAQTQNQANVAAALDSYIEATSGDRQVVSTALDLQTISEYPAAFEAIAPGFYQSLAQISIEQANAQSQMIAQRLSAVRLGVDGFSLGNLEMALKNDRDGKSVMEAKDAKSMISPINTDPRWAMWVQGNGIFGRSTSVSDVPNYRSQSGGFLGGADYRWSENFSTGIYAGYQGTYSRYSGGSSSTINSALFGLYATYQTGGFYMDAIIGGAYNNYNNSRSIEFSTIDRTARSEAESGQFSAYLDAGYDWKVGGFTFGPILSGQYTYTGFAPFDESGAGSLDLAVGRQNANSIRSNVGGRIAYTWNVAENITIIPEGRLFWQHEYLNGPRNIDATLDGGSGPSFGFETSAPGRDSVFAGAGVSANFGERWMTSFYYNADFGRQDFTNHIISANLTFKF